MDFEKRLKEMSELQSSTPLFSMDGISEKLDTLQKDTKSKTNGRVKMAIGTGISMLAVLSYFLLTGNDQPKANVSQFTSEAKSEVNTVQTIKSDKKNIIEFKDEISDSKQGTENKTEATEKSKETFFIQSFSFNSDDYQPGLDVNKSEADWKAAMEGRVLSLPTISQNEAEALGISFDGKYMSYTIEFLDRFYPVSYKKSDYYREKQEVQSFVQLGYPLDNSEFLYKKLYVTDLSKNIEEIQMLSNTSYNKLEHEVNLSSRGISLPKGHPISRAIHCDTILKYDGTLPGGYSPLAPVYIYIQNKGKLNNFQVSKIMHKTAAMAANNIKDLKNLRKFIPVKINLAEDFSPSIESIVFWFVPSEELFSKLPVDIGRELKRQYDIAQLYETGALSKSEACGEVLDKDYLGICALTNQDFSVISVHPNPVGDLLNIKLKVQNADKYDFEIFDQSGVKTDIHLNMDLVKGEQMLGIAVSKLTGGMYFLRISDSRGNYITSSIIKE